MKKNFCEANSHRFRNLPNSHLELKALLEDTLLTFLSRKSLFDKALRTIVDHSSR